MADHATVIRVSHIHPAAGKHDDVITRIGPAVATMRSVEGCFGVQVCDVRETPGVLSVVSRWANQAALDQIETAGVMNDSGIADLITPPSSVEQLVPVGG